MSASLGCPGGRDRDEVLGVVGHQCPSLGGAGGQEILITHGVPATLVGGDDVVAEVDEPVGEDARVVVVEAEPHDSSACCRSHRWRCSSA